MPTTLPWALFLTVILLMACAALYWRLAKRGRTELGLGELVHIVESTRLSNDPVCLLDAKGCITWANAAYQELTGYVQEELLGLSLHELSRRHIDDSATLEALHTAMQDARELRIDAQLRPRNGSTFWTIIELHPIFHPQRRSLIGYAVVQINIDNRRRQRKLTEQALRDRQEVLNILDHHALVTESNLTGTITRVNQRFMDVSGYTEAELLGKNHNIVSSKTHSSEFWKTVWETISQGQIWRGEICNRAKDGSLYWVDSVIAPMLGTDGRPLSYVSIRTDITALVTAQKQAQASERLLRSAIDALDEAFALYDRHERLVFCNDKYRALFDPEHKQETVVGLSAEQVLRMSIAEKTYVAATENPEAWLNEQLNLWRQPSYQQRAQLTNGRWVKSIGLVTPDGMLAMFRVDVTDLQLALEAADAASLSKSQFLANMSHEIRTPMNAILGMLQLLQQSSLNAEQQDLLSHTEGAARSLLAILNDVLDLSKVEAGKMSLDIQPFKLDSLLDDLATILYGASQRPSLELIYDIDPSAPSALIGDPVRLKQILINLGGNAIKFTEQGEVRVMLRVLQRTAQEVSLRFSVVDSGIGIDPESFADLFTAFSQAESSTSRRYGGTGLGLAISQRLVTLMGSSLELMSEPGRGSCFYFDITLPIDKTSPQRKPSPALKVASVLLMEPHAASQQAIGKMLRHGLGAAIQTFDNVETSVAAVRAGLAPNLAVVNADVDGFSHLIDMLRDHALAANTPSPLILLVTSRQRFTPTGLPTLRKPLTFSRVHSALRRAEEPQPSNQQTVHAQQRLRGLRLLLVEDNEINQMVAVRLLENEGAAIDVAENGQKGLDALLAASEPYDLVLMDVQMPIMDGLQATQEIRRLPRFATLPIVAMTAGVQQTDEQASIKVGMNAHIGKPFELTDLLEVILRLTKGHPTNAAPTPRLPSDAPAEQATTTTLNTEIALARLEHDQDFYIQLLKDFSVLARRLMRQITQAILEDDSQQVHAAAHQLKSTAATVGAQELSTLCAKLEKAALQQPQTLRATIETLQPTLERALSAQEEWLQSQLQAAPTAQLQGNTNPSEVLAALKAALLDQDMQALELCDELMAVCDTNEFPALRDLQRAIDAFDTEKALVIVAALREALSLASTAQ